MLSPNSHYSNFRLTFPNEFFLESVSKKYNLIVKQFDWPLKDIQTMVKESFQGIELKGFGYEPYSQGVTDVNNGGYQWNQPPKTSEQLLLDNKILELTFRHIDSFITYFYLLELFFTYYQLGPNNPTKRQPFGFLILDTLDTMSKKPICRVKYHKCSLIGLSPLELTYSDPKRDLSTFTIQIAFTEFETAIEVPDLILKK